MMRLDIQTRQRRWGIVFATLTLITYILVFFLLYPSLKESVAVLAILPVVAVAWLGGARLGTFAGVVSIALNTLLLNLVEPRANPWTVLIQSGGGPGSLAVVLIAFIIGALQDKRVQAAGELAKHHRAETALSESEQRYRDLFESAQRQAQELALLDRVQQALARELELTLIFRTVVEGIAHTFGYTQVSLYLVDDRDLVLQHQVGYDHSINRIPVTEGIVGRVVRTQVPVLLEDVSRDPAFLGAIEGITSEVCVPLFDQGQVVGVLNVESTRGVRLSGADLHLMLSLGQQISIALGRARLYNEVRESEQRFRQLAEHIKQVFWLEDLESSRIIYVSPAYEIMWGRTRESLYMQPQSWFDAIHPDDLERVLVAQEGKPKGQYDLEYRVIHPNGSLRWIWSRAFPIMNEQGQIYRIAGIAEDITDRKATEVELRAANQKQVQALKDLEERTRHLALLNKLMDLWQTCRTPAEVYDLISLFGAQFFAEDSGVLYIRDPSHELLQQVATWNMEHDAVAYAWSADDCYALRQSKIFIVEAGTLFCPHVHLPYPLASLCMPLISQGEALGLLHLRSRTVQYPGGLPVGNEHFSVAKQELVRTLVESLTLTLANLNLRDILREQAIRDPLTGLFNRRYLTEMLEREMKRVSRSLRPLSIMMLDIDHFKEFNDKFGHAAGDVLLKTLGGLLESHVRGEDIASRYGGEEFVLVLPEASLEATRTRAEQLLEEIKHMDVYLNGRPLGSVTVSLGVAGFPEHGHTPEAILLAADQALYRAKRAGRDQVMVGE